MWAGLGSPGPGRAGRTQLPASGEEQQGRLAPGPGGRGMRWAGALVLGTREAQGCPPPLRDLRGPTIPLARSGGCLAGEAAGSAEPTPAHIIPESMLSAALGTSCRVASRPGPLLAPSRPAAGKLGGAAPSSRPFASPRPLPRLCPAPRAALAGRPRGREWGRGRYPQLPEVRSEAGWPEAWR